MALKNKTTGGSVVRPATIYTMNNEAFSVVGGTNHLVGWFNYRVRDWNTQAGWKSTLATRGYLDTLSYRDITVNEKVKWFDGIYRARSKANPKNGYAWKCVAYPGVSEVQIAMPAHDSNLLLEAQTSCLDKARQMRVNLAVSVGEGKTTFQMLRNSVVTLRNAYGHFRKGRFKRAAKALGIDKPADSVANNWLAYQYGWKPLVSDAVGLVEAHRDQFSTARQQRFIVRSMRQRVDSGSRVISNFWLTGNHAKTYDTDVYVARAGLVLEVTSRLDQFRASVGLSAGDILSTAWELVPYSFVFDWFVDVGSWLGNLNALSGITVLDGWAISETQRTCNLLPSGSSSSQYTLEVPDCFVTKRVFNRSRWTGGTLTWPRVRSITDLSATQLISAAALAAQQFRGDPPIGKFRPAATE